MAGHVTSEIENCAKSALAESPFHALHQLQVQRVDEGLLISGSVSSFYHKQVAQEVVRAVANGTRVINSVHVR